MKIYVLDTCAFIMGLNPSLLTGRFYSVPSVIKELPSGSMSLLRLRTSQEAGHLIIMNSSDEYYEKVIKISKELGELFSLSKADMQVIALALELEEKGLKPIIITDDYAIQNTAEHLGISFQSISTFGIVYEFYWQIYCPACYKIYSQEYDQTFCQICGTRLKRKVIKKLETSKDKSV